MNLPHAFDEDDLRVLTPEAFELLLVNELRRAMRSQNFLTLVLLDASGTSEDPILEIARVIGEDVRETDVLARTEGRHLALVLLDADLSSSRKVIDRLMARLEQYHFAEPVEIAVGAACCPTDATDAESLRRHAAAQAIVTGRSGGPSPSRS